MVVNNFESIKNILDFNGNSIYLVWLVMRNKDGNTQVKGNNRNRTIKSYYFISKEQFEARQDEITRLEGLISTLTTNLTNLTESFNTLNSEFIALKTKVELEHPIDEEGTTSKS